MSNAMKHIKRPSHNRILKQNSKIYIEVPCPDAERQHEFNLNHYSIFGHNMLAALLIRTGFRVDKFNILEFDVALKESVESEVTKTLKEKFYCVVATKDRPLDLK